MMRLATLLAFAVGLAETAVAAPALDIQGRLMVGTETYSVAGDIWLDRQRRVHVTFEVLGRGNNRQLIAVLGESGGYAFVDGERQELPSDKALSWERQIRTGFRDLVAGGEWRCTDFAAEKRCDSPGLVRLSNFLPGRLRLIYNRAQPGDRLLVNDGWRLRELRFFSLAEWNNDFGEYASLSLEFR